MITYIFKCNRCFIPERVVKFDSLEASKEAGWYSNEENDCLCPKCVKELNEEESERLQREIAFWDNL